MAPKNKKSSSQQQEEKPAAASAAAVAPSSPTTEFKIPKASPIANYKDEELTERQKFLLGKMANLKFFKPKELPPPRLNRNRGWYYVLSEKYNIESALYMLEPWERYLLNTFLVLFIVLLGFWLVWLWQATNEFYREMGAPYLKWLTEKLLEQSGGGGRK